MALVVGSTRARFMLAGLVVARGKLTRDIVATAAILARVTVLWNMQFGGRYRTGMAFRGYDSTVRRKKD